MGRGIKNNMMHIFVNKTKTVSEETVHSPKHQVLHNTILSNGSYKVGSTAVTQ
jgi:hypothetical protein